mmetsp:Transcript_27707/g.85671  ORF Transcript_27707/g.85671 Transcript_27707/m.85671 type:complete len:224 (+) Transcript_27707:462-1133(+)
MSMFSTPLFSVTDDDGQPTHEPASSTDTMPVASSKPRKKMSPPSSWTAGRMRTSMSSLIIATTSESVSRISVSDATASPDAMASEPSAKKSMMCEKTCGLIVAHAPSSSFETVTKSLATKMPVTLSIEKSFRASGDRSASGSPFVKWKPLVVSAPSFTGWLGRNLSENGFGVFSTWMKTLLAARFSAAARPPKATAPRRSASMLLRGVDLRLLPPGLVPRVWR